VGFTSQYPCYVFHIFSRFAYAGALTIAIGFAFVAAGGHSLAWLVGGMVLLDLGNRASVIANQARIYALRPEARSRLNTVFLVSYFLGGAFGTAPGGAGVLHAGWRGLAAGGASLAFAAVAVNALANTSTTSAVADGRA
jgi:predicted MFS family arabinose efflux permease